MMSDGMSQAIACKKLPTTDPASESKSIGRRPKRSDNLPMNRLDMN